MIDLTRAYSSTIDGLEKIQGRIKHKRNIFFTAKIVTFIPFLIAIYYSFNGISFFIPILLLSCYVVSVYLDSKEALHEQKIKELIRSYSLEVDYLKNDFSKLNNGDKYISTDHDYAFDLDIFGDKSLFQEIDRTITARGSDLLARLLQYPDIRVETILNRQQAIEDLSENMDWTHEFRVAGKLHPTSGFDENIIKQWKMTKYYRGVNVRPLLLFLNGLTFTLLLLAILNIIPFFPFTTVAIVQFFLWLFMTKSINKIHLQLDQTIKATSNYFYLISLIGDIKFSAKELKQLQSDLLGKDDALLAFKKLKRLQDNLDQRGNVLVSAALNALYLKDIHTTVKLMKWRDQYINNIVRWVDTVSMFDALISFANYKYNHPDFVFPEISSEIILFAEDIAHPMMKGNHVIGNDIAINKLHEIYITTGANMSGKSTFLRSVGINMVLAQSGCVVRSKKFIFMPIDLFTSMRTTDNLSKGESYFHAELLRLKALHEKAQHGNPVFVILDEMLKGTNSKDKLNGSLKFLIKLLELNISGIIATHDLALGGLSETHPDNFHNICFEIEQSGEELVYSYKLQNGISKNMNATFLMEQLELI